MHSIKKRHLISFSVAVTVVAAFGYMFKPKYRPMNPNVPTSIFTSKGVADRTVQLSVSAKEIPDSDIAEVTVKMELPFDLNQPFNYKWKLSPGVELAEGSLTGEIPGYKKDQATSFSLRVRGFVKDVPRQVGFEVSTLVRGRKIYGDTIISSDAENTFENIVQNVEKIKASE